MERDDERSREPSQHMEIQPILGTALAREPSPALSEGIEKDRAKLQHSEFCQCEPSLAREIVCRTFREALPNPVETRTRTHYASSASRRSPSAAGKRERVARIGPQQIFLVGNPRVRQTDDCRMEPIK